MLLSNREEKARFHWISHYTMYTCAVNNGNVLCGLHSNDHKLLVKLIIFIGGQAGDSTYVTNSN